MKNEKFEKSLDSLFETWKYVKRDTINTLGIEKTQHIIDFHGNIIIDISSWIYNKYNKEEHKNIVFVEFTRLFKEIYWIQFLFLHANYPIIYRNLRYCLEMMSQAYYVDQQNPIYNIDKQVEMITEFEEKTYGWKIVEPVLCKIFESNGKDIKEKYKPVWDFLNKHVHSSALQMQMIATEDIKSLVTDSFNENLAKKALEVFDKIFDLIYSIVFNKYPEIKEKALEYTFINEWEEFIPITMKIIRTK
ncbi:hypothetical protein ACFL30_00100 [Candidatus Latescibacterota bacterium]